MAEETTKPTGTNISESEDKGMNFMDIFFLCLSKWYWIVTSVIVCLVLAILYIKITPPTYKRTATVLIKDDAPKRFSGSINLSELADMGMTSNVQNEILTFQSPSLMKGVVEQLRLDVNCYADGFFYDRLLYGTNLPYKVEIFDLDEVPIYGRLKIQDNNTFEFKVEAYDEEKYDDIIIKGQLLDTIKLAKGRMLVSPNDIYMPIDEEENITEMEIYKLRIQTAMERCLNRISVEQTSRQADVITLSYVDVSEERATDIINTTIQIYNANWLKEKNLLAKSTSEFINDRLAVIEEELSYVDDSISTYKSNNRIPDIEQAAGMYFAKSNEAYDKLIDLYTRKSMANKVYQQLRDNLSSNQLLPANAVFENQSLEKLITEYNNTLLLRNSTATNSNDQNPYVLELGQKLDEMNKAISSSLENYIYRINSEIKALEQKEASSNSQLTTSPAQAKHLLSVGRQQKVKESLYLYLLQKREENEISQTFAAYNTRIIDWAIGSYKPIAPSKKKILLIAFAIGFIIPIGIIYLIETLNTKVRGRQDIERLVIPYIGEIPYAGKKKKQRISLTQSVKKKIKEIKVGHTIIEEDTKREIVVKDHKRDVINEAFRVIRTNLEFMLNKDDQKVIMTSSFNPGSGKTFLGMNIAVSYAIKGKKVVIIDLDLRKASLSTYVNSPAQGVADYLNGTVSDFHDVMVRGTLRPELDVIPVGKMPPNPSELLYSPRLKEMIDRLRQEYDYVFLDCPPVEMLADSTIINKLVDCTLFIIRAGLLERSMLSTIDTMYNEKRYNNMALILNGTMPMGRNYGYSKYGYYSRYGYGYGYGYGSHYGSDKD